MTTIRPIDLPENLIVLGPPGPGKTHLAIALSLQALYAGYTVCFERMSNMVRLLKTGELHRVRMTPPDKAGYHSLW